MPRQGPTRPVRLQAQSCLRFKFHKVNAAPVGPKRQPKPAVSVEKRTRVDGVVVVCCRGPDDNTCIAPTVTFGVWVQCFVSSETYGRLAGPPTRYGVVQK